MTTLECDGIKSINSHSITLLNPFVTAMLLCCALMYVIYCLGVGIPESVLPLCFVVVLPFFREKEFLALGACLPLIAGIPHFRLFLILAIILYFTKYYRKFKIRSIWWVVLGFVLLEFLDGFGKGYFQWWQFFAWAGLLFYFALCVNMLVDINPPDILEIMQYYAVTYCCVAFTILQRFAMESGDLLGYLFAGKRLGDMANFYGKVQETGISNGLSFNPNELGVLSVMCFGICLLLLHLHFGRRIVWISIACFATAIVLLTLSRGAMVMWTAATLIYFLDYRTLKKYFILAPILLLVVVGLGFALYSCSDSVAMMVDNMIGRFTTGGDISAGRLDLWEMWNDYFFSHPSAWLTGIGSNNLAYRIDVADEFGIHNCIHGGFQEAYVYWGFIGLFLMFAFNWSICKVAHKAVNGTMMKLNFLLMIAIWLQFSKGQYMSGAFCDQIIAAVAMAYPFWRHENVEIENAKLPDIRKIC